MHLMPIEILWTFNNNLYVCEGGWHVLLTIVLYGQFFIPGVKIVDNDENNFISYNNKTWNGINDQTNFI